MEPSVVKKNTKKLALWISGLFFVSVIVAIITFSTFVLNQKTIYDNVYVESVDLGHLTKEDAKLSLEKIFEKELQSHHLMLRHQETTWDYTYEKLGFTYLYNEAIEEAYSVGRSGSFFSRLVDIYHLRKNPVLITLNNVYDHQILDEILVELNETIQKPPVDAKIQRRDNGFAISKEANGIEVDEMELRTRIKYAIDIYSDDSIDVPVQYVVPKITEEKLKDIKEIVGEFSTVFNSEVTGRSANISVASKSINGTLLMPGDSFSFNKQTGPRGIKEGYQEAPVIFNGQLIPGIGGGICQVSSTLYNAVVRADLEITNRQNHSLPVAYVPLGQDATVAYGYIDFQFINNTPYPLYVESSVNGNRINVRIYGKKIHDYTVRLFSEVTETIEPKMEIKKDSSMFVGERKVEREAKKGYKVNTYKVYYRNDKEFMRELISRDVYSVVHGVVIEGTKPRPPQPKVEVKEEKPPAKPQEEKKPEVKKPEEAPVDNDDSGEKKPEN